MVMGSSQRETEIEFSPQFRLKLQLEDFSIINDALQSRRSTDTEALAKRFVDAENAGPTCDARFHFIVTGREFTSIIRKLNSLKRRDASKVVARLKLARAKLSGDYSKQVSETLNAKKEEAC